MPSRLRRAAAAGALLATIVPFALADTALPTLSDEDFAACVVDLKETARTRGISETVVQDVLANVSYLEQVIELDRRQPEFTQPFTEYYNRRVSAARVARGRALLAEHGALLSDVQREYGVPGHYLLAFWGLETNFGSYFGSTPVPDSLATLACDPRRSRFFTEELMAALRIVDHGDSEPSAMVGSCAGAMGHVQFMPSVFLRYAVDADGDGRRDLWGSIPDALHSAGRFLSELGWEPGLRWGREVLLPDGFDFARTGRGNRAPLREWRSLGVTDAFGRPLPELDLPAALLVPSGHRGPAFLTYRNFDVVMGWNRSEFYALTVGRLADEIAGAGPLRRPPPENAARFSRPEVLVLQRQLNRLGYDAGEPDGIVGPATRAALSRFQSDRNLIADGHLDAEMFEAVRRAAAKEDETT
jgi:membrane-bound lytic murein transglycosylase B